MTDKINEVVFGIDLGTTNSCIAKFESGAFTIIPIDGGETVPSVVALNGETFLVGRQAANFGLVNPLLAVRSVKRRIGDANHHFKLGERTFNATELSAKILCYLKEQAEKATGLNVEDVVITVPAWFNDAQRQATLKAGLQAGLNVLQIINEPTAAALAYEVNDSEVGKNETGDSTWLVYDLGGGTFDVSVVRTRPGYKEVLSSCGNTFLGGDDFDQRILIFLIDQIKDTYNIDVSNDVVACARLRHLAEETKIRLSTEVSVRMLETFTFQEVSYQLDVEISREKFEGMVRDLIDSTIQNTRQAMEEAYLTPTQISRLLLVGGASRIPLVAESLAKVFEIAPDAFVDPDLSVGLGASVQAAIASGKTFSQTVVDVAPRSLGVACLGELDAERNLGFLDDFLIDEISDEDGENSSIKAHHPRTFVEIIRRNVKLPAKFVKEFFTAVDGQRAVEVAVYQGESKNTRENHFIGSFLAKVAPCPAGTAVRIGFEYDFNGVVKISVATGKGDTVAENYTMDLNRSSSMNTQSKLLQRMQPAGDYDLNEEDESSSLPENANVMNFLVEKVQARLKGRAAADAASIQVKLDEYRKLLAVGEDDRMDVLEEELYEWLDNSESLQQ
jgi:molecular chaperone DnaK